MSVTDLPDRLRQHAELHADLPDDEQQQWMRELLEAADEIERLRADCTQLRADAIDRQNNVVAPLQERVRVLEDALRAIAWSRPPGPTSKMVEALEAKALAALEQKP